VKSTKEIEFSSTLKVIQISTLLSNF